MKKLIAFVLLISVLAGCAPKTPDITMEDVYRANSTESILNRFKSFQVALLREDEPYVTYYYDDQLYLSEWADYAGYHEIIWEDYVFVHQQDAYFGYLLADGGNYRADIESQILGADTVNETIIDITEKSGSITLTTRADGSTTKDYMENALGIPYAEGDYMECVYTLNASDLLITHLSARIVYDDGSLAAEEAARVEYGAARPEWTKEMAEKCLPENDARTLTVVTDPNTKDEKVYYCAVKKGNHFYVLLPDGYALYDDEACTIPSQSSDDTDSHMLKFAKKAQ